LLKVQEVGKGVEKASERELLKFDGIYGGNRKILS
jgi:hypothetical protein